MSPKDRLREELDDTIASKDRRTAQSKGEIEVSDLDEDDLGHLREEDLSNLNENELAELNTQIGVARQLDIDDGDE